MPDQVQQGVNPKIAVVVHFGGNVVSVDSWWTAGQNPAQRLSWLLGKLGVIKEGISIFGASAGNLQLANDSGVISYDSADAEKYPNNPDEQVVPSADPISTFILAKQDATVNFAQTVIDPTQIDVGGVLTPLTGNDKVSIQRIYVNLNGSFAVQYGQNAYATIQEATTALVRSGILFSNGPYLKKWGGLQLTSL